MFRMFCGCGVVAFSLILTGCTMCCHPYDKCGPVFDRGGGCGSCSLRARSGSVFADGYGNSTGGEMVHSQAKSQPKRSSSQPSVSGLARSERRIGDVPGSEKVISVTDRTVSPNAVPAVPANSVAEAESSAESSTESSKPLPSSGWTARRPPPDELR